jgi:hypothetical protein
VEARDFYSDGMRRTERELGVEERRVRAIGFARLAVAASILAVIVAIVWVPLPLHTWVVVGVLVLAFMALVVVHSRAFTRKARALATRRFHDRGLARLDGRWSGFGASGERFRNPNHAYADDLDLFGRASVFQLLDASETRFGEEQLASWLLAPADLESLSARQAAVKELSSRAAFREQLSTFGALVSADKPDVRPFLAWAEGSQGSLPASPALVWAARVLPLVTIGLFSVRHRVPGLWLLVLVVELIVVGLFRGKTTPIVSAVSSREVGLVRYGDLFAVVEAEPFQSPRLKALKEQLQSTGARVTVEMARLSRIVSFCDARNNEVFRLVVAPVLMWDLNCALALERWRRRTGTSVRGWFEAIGEIEALASLAGLAFDRPESAWPELIDSPRLEAIALGHPLIDPHARVDNDVALPAAGATLVVSGSNMSGKSTLLRAIGVNAVLALAGAPVCASKLTIGPLAVATSLRVRDSLEEGVSHFYAELRKLKRVVDLARSPKAGNAHYVLFLLDEILHGTNSRERLIGARAIVRELVRRGAVGAVSTHDLALGDLQNELKGLVTNVHFEEQVTADDTMTFDYKLRQGVVQSSNALRLMKIVGLDVVD